MDDIVFIHKSLSEVIPTDGTLTIKEVDVLLSDDIVLEWRQLLHEAVNALRGLVGSVSPHKLLINSIELLVSAPLHSVLRSIESFGSEDSVVTRLK